MDVKKAADDVVKHVKKHKEAYIVGTLGVVGIVLTVVIMKNYGSIKTINVMDNSGAVLIQPKIENAHFYSPGNSGNVIQDLTTGAIYPSQEAAANALGVSRSQISQHVNGKLPDLRGHILEKIVDGVTEYELVRH